MPHFSVIMPAYNSERVLPHTLAALWAQDQPAGWAGEVIVSDDGSHDGTLSYLRAVRPPAPWRLVVLSGTHRGAAQARNRALARATGELVLLLGADIVLRPGALAVHWRFHEQHPDVHAAALGFIQWDPRLHPSRLMVWMAHGGHHNDYDALLGVRQADPAHFFYGSFVSLKRSLLPAVPFSPAFRGYGWEDLELGRRLKRQGLQLSVLADARAVHMHHYSVAQVCRRQAAVGESLHLYHRLHPTAGLAPLASWHHRLATLLGVPWGLRLLVTAAARYYTFPRLFAWLTAAYFWQGWYSGFNESAPAALPRRTRAAS